MAGALKIRTIINCTGLGDEFTIDTGEITQEVPVEHGGSGKYVIHATAGTTAIQLSDLFPQMGLDKIYCVYIECISGAIYVMLNTSGTTTFDETTADLQIKEGRGIPIMTNTDLTSANGMTIDAASTDDAFIITAFAKA